jgi:hypothetical protein
MLLFYIDESGTGLKDARTPFFVLAAVAIHVRDWQEVDSQIASLKRRLSVGRSQRISRSKAATCGAVRSSSGARTGKHAPRLSTTWRN